MATAISDDDHGDVSDDKATAHAPAKISPPHSQSSVNAARCLIVLAVGTEYMENA